MLGAQYLLFGGVPEWLNGQFSKNLEGESLTQVQILPPPPMKKQKSKKEFSAGGVVYKKGKDGVKWLVCKHSGYHRWILPKGLIEKGESLEETAEREVEEECGIKVKVIEKLKDVEKYVYTMNGVKIFKQAVYFLMEYESGDIRDYDWEMEEVEWLEYEEAYKRLEYAGAKMALKKAKETFKEKEKQLRLV